MLILTYRKDEAIKLRECEEHGRRVNFSSFTWLLLKKIATLSGTIKAREGLGKQATHWVNKALIKC